MSAPERLAPILSRLGLDAPSLAPTSELQRKRAALSLTAADFLPSARARELANALSLTAADFLPSARARELANACAKALSCGESVACIRDAIEHRREHPRVYGAAWREIDATSAEALYEAMARAWER